MGMKYFLILCCVIQGYLNDFIPTSEFQTIPDGVNIPPGLHVRVDINTGLKQAKLVDNNWKGTVDSEALTLISNKEKAAEQTQNPLQQALDSKIHQKQPLPIIKKRGPDAEQIEVHLKKLQELQSNPKSIYHSTNPKDLQEVECLLEDIEELALDHYAGIELTLPKNFPSILHVLTQPEPAHKYSTRRIIAALIIGNALQNNEVAQEAALQQQIFSVLLKVFAHEKDERLRARLIFALSASIRSNLKATMEFNKLSGCLYGHFYDDIRSNNLFQKKILKFFNAKIADVIFNEVPISKTDLKYLKDILYEFVQLKQNLNAEVLGEIRNILKLLEQNSLHLFENPLERFELLQLKNEFI